MEVSDEAASKDSAKSVIPGQAVLGSLQPPGDSLLTGNRKLSMTVLPPEAGQRRSHGSHAGPEGRAFVASSRLWDGTEVFLFGKPMASQMKDSSQDHSERICCLNTNRNL